jgi:cytochrome c peroxidase
MSIMRFSHSRKSVRKNGRSGYFFQVLAAVVLIGIVLGTADHTYAQLPGHDGSSVGQEQDNPPGSLLNRDPSGFSLTLSTSGDVDFTNPFFQPLGTNGRTCATCHEPADGWSVSASHVRSRFSRSRGEDPIFRLIDGANCPTADISTRETREEAYSLLLQKGLIRIQRAVSPASQFTITAIDDPYQCSTPTSVSVHRRPLPATNLKFLTTPMWDARELRSLNFTQDLLVQARDAVLDHMQPTVAPDFATLQQIVNFELATFTAQDFDKRAQSLTADGADGGPEELSKQNFFLGINDGLNSTPISPFDNNAFKLFANWETIPNDGDPHRSLEEARKAIARGENIFNTREFEFTGVPGFNPGRRGFCSSCHNTPNVGSSSLPALINIGIADASRRTPDLPLFTLQDKTTGAIVQTTDPGGAITTGLTSFIGSFKVPNLRGLPTRAPYFHDGSAATLEEVVDFYNVRFNIGLTSQEQSDLAAFLRAL